MPLHKPILDDRSFDDLVAEGKRTASRSLIAHELTHVVQQTTSTRQGRHRMADRVKDVDPILWFALTSGAPLTERQSEKLKQILAQSD